MGRCGGFHRLHQLQGPVGPAGVPVKAAAEAEGERGFLQKGLGHPGGVHRPVISGEPPLPHHSVAVLRPLRLHLPELELQAAVGEAVRQGGGGLRSSLRGEPGRPAPPPASRPAPLGRWKRGARRPAERPEARRSAGAVWRCAEPAFSRRSLHRQNQGRLYSFFRIAWRAWSRQPFPGADFLLTKGGISVILEKNKAR